MVLLLGFALVAGFATALSPCSLPVLPVALSAGATGGRRRPLGIVTGLVLAFTFSTIALVYVIAALGLPDDVVRTVAVIVLVAFGASLVVPALSARIEAWLSRFGRAPRATSASGFASGLPLGVSLGFLYAPCAGPILAGVITVSAAQTFTAGRLAVALAYGLGSAVAFYGLMLGGRRFLRGLIGRSGRVQQALGVLMIAVAALVFTDVDVRFQNAIASDLPSFLVDPGRKVETGGAIKGPLLSASGREAAEERGKPEAASGRRLPVLGLAPEFMDTGRWFNTPDERPLTMRGLRGRVVLVDFWTYTCINCIRTFPHLKALDARYRSRGLTIVGVHSPEFPFERIASNVEASIKQNGLRYPVVQDNEFGTWNAYSNQYWPADYLIDANGHIRYVHFGEGEYEENEQAVRSLLEEAGRGGLGEMTHPRVERPSRLATPETYLGSARAQGFVNGAIEPGTRAFERSSGKLGLNEFEYSGRWSIGTEEATARAGARLRVRFLAQKVFLVMGSRGRARKLRVLLDGRPVPQRFAGPDVRGGSATIGSQRLYRLITLPRPEKHVLELSFEPGISCYAFTFG